MSTETTTARPTSPLVLGVPLTHSDWMLRPNVAWGPEGIHYMLDQCKASGWTRVYWRAFDGGRALYNSAYTEWMGPWDTDNYWDPQDPKDMPHAYWTQGPKEERDKIVEELFKLDYEGFDTLAEAVSYGHSIGIEVHAWVTINEDDHGWGLTSRFTQNNPHSRWIKRDGTPYHSQQSFAFPEVREYKLGVVRELIKNYDIDGIFLDWMRTGDVRDNPQSDAEGIADFGYEKPLVESFKAEYGVDPHELPSGDERWVAWRAQPQTEFMREARKLMKSIKPELPLAVMGQHPWALRGLGDKIDGNLRGLLLDVKTWAEEGLIDEATVAGYYRDGGNAELAYNWLRNELPTSVDVWQWGWVPETPEAFDNEFALSQKLGVKQVLFWEADYIDTRANKEVLQQHMREAIGQ
jgi:uncharacterized lipoprotein YddW (UPF0748 family)